MGDVGLKQLGLAIRHAREAMRMTQDTLAAETGYEQPQISRIERGRSGMPQESIIKLAKALRTSPSALWAAAEGVQAPKVAAPVPDATDELIEVVATVAKALIVTIPTASEPLLDALDALESDLGSALASTLRSNPARSGSRPSPKPHAASSRSRKPSGP
jgi:transcriptional regulator with XRE-family HTH domain